MVRDELTYRLEKDIKGKWCLPIMHESGRDFYDLKPIQYLTVTEKDNLQVDVLEDVHCDCDNDEFVSYFPTEIQELKDDYYTDIDVMRDYIEEGVFEYVFDKLIEEGDN